MRTRNSEQEDYLIRMIQEMGRAIARLREMLLGQAFSGASVRAEVLQSTAQLLGPDCKMLAQLDALSAVRLVGSQERVTMWVQLLELEAEAWAADEANARATELRERAQSLRSAMKGLVTE